MTDDCKDGCAAEPNLFWFGDSKQKHQQAIAKLATRIQQADNRDDIIEWFNNATAGKLEDPLAITRLFGEDAEARLAVPAVDVAKIIAICQGACNVVKFLNNSVCPIVGKL